MNYTLPFTRAELGELWDTHALTTGYFDVKAELDNSADIQVDPARLLVYSDGLNLGTVLNKLNRSVEESAKQTFPYTYLYGEFSQAIHPYNHAYYGKDLVDWTVENVTPRLFRDWHAIISIKQIKTEVRLLIHIRGRDLEAVLRAKDDKYLRIGD